VSVWIYQSTQSVSAFSALLLANTVPGMVAAPFAGSIVDRSSRKRVMIGAATVSLVGTLIVLAGALLGELSMPIVVAGASLASIGDAFQWPALSATIPLMATDEDLPRYNGFLESGRAVSMLAGPAIGGFLLAILGLPGLVAIELVTFALATVVVASMVIPRPSGGAAEEEQVSLLADSVYGIKWIVAHRPLFKFLLVATFANFFIGIGMVIMPPYGLSFLGERAYGITNGMFGAGMILGGLVFGLLSRWLKSIQQFLWAAVVLGGVYVAYGFSRDAFTLGTMNLLIAVMMTIANAAIMTVWQLKVPEELQGRVLSTMRLVADLTIPLSFLLAGPLTDHFAPWVFAHSGASSIWGSSPTSEMGAVFSVMGAFLLAGFAIAFTVREIRQVEDIPA
jgi:MFS family permease